MTFFSWVAVLWISWLADTRAHVNQCLCRQIGAFLIRLEVALSQNLRCDKHLQSASLQA